MSNSKISNHTLAFITVAFILIGAVSYTIYNKFTTVKKDDMAEVAYDNSSAHISKEEYSEEQSYESATQKTLDITGKVVSVNTNAEKKTFIKVKSFIDQNNYTLLTSLDADLVDIKLGDIISFPSNLKKSNNNAYYFINKVTDYNIVEKNTVMDIGVGTVAIADIEPSMEGRDIILSGVISDLSTSKKGHSFFTLTDAGYSINGVLFDSEANQLEDRLSLLNQYEDTLKKVNLEGKVGVYKGELQIIVSKIYN